MSEIDRVHFFIREPDGMEGTPLSPVGYEYLIGALDNFTGKWGYEIDSTQLPDGYYIVFARVIDISGNEGWLVGSFTFETKK